MCPLRLFFLMKEFSEIIPLQGITSGAQGDSISLKDWKIQWEMKVNEIKIKKYLETLIALWLKWTGMVEIKHKDLLDMVPIMLCHNSLWIMGLRIYGEGKTQILLSSPTSIDPLVHKIQDRQGLY